MRTYLICLLATLALVSCGGGNDVASTGASAVSAAASATTTTATASAPSTLATPTTEPKVNGQIDERTGVAPVVAQAAIGGTCSYNGVTNIQAGVPCSFKNCLGVIFGDTFSGFALPNQQWINACNLIGLNNYNNPNQCIFIGGTPIAAGCSGWDTVLSLVNINSVTLMYPKINLFSFQLS